MKFLYILLFIFTLTSCFWWESDFQKNASDNDKTREKTILALWDSLTYWYKVDRGDAYPSQLNKLLIDNWYNYKIINWWISGDTTSWLLARSDNFDSPDILLLAIWANDWLRWKSLKNMKSNIQEIINKFNKNNTKILLIGTDILPTYWFWYRSDFKRVYQELKDENNWIYLYENILKSVALKHELNISDNIHPNKKGYKIISDNIFNSLLDAKILLKKDS